MAARKNTTTAPTAEQIAVKVAAERTRQLAALATPVAELGTANITVKDCKVAIGRTVWAGYVAIRTAMGETPPVDADQFSEKIWANICTAWGFDRSPGAPKVALGKVTRGVSSLSEDFDTFRCASHWDAAVAEADSEAISVVLPIMRRMAGLDTRAPKAENTATALTNIGTTLADAGVSLDTAKANSATSATVRSAAWTALGDTWQDMLSTYSEKISGASVAELRSVARIFSAAADAKVKADKDSKVKDSENTAKVDSKDAGTVSESVADENTAKLFADFLAFRKLAAAAS